MNSQFSKRFLRGFGLVEVMVGMVIGMLGIIIMLQVYSSSEQSKRSATGSDDAQNTGIIALYTLQRDLRQAGYGFAAIEAFGCSLAMPGGWTISTLAPVVINPAGTAPIPAGDANTDVLMVAYGSSANAPLGDPIISQTRASFLYKPKTPTSYAVGEWVVATPSSRAPTCSLSMERIQNITPAPPELPTTLTMTSDVGDRSNGNIYNLGQSPIIFVYAVRNGNLTVCDYSARNCADATKTNDETFWTPIANNIVSMRAQYGRDNRSLADIVAAGNTYVFNHHDQTAPTAADFCQWSKIGSTRVALVARNSQYDPQLVTAAAPTWSGSGTHPIDLTKRPDGAANPDWQHYRYKTFETVIPLRNIAWMGVQGC